MTVAPSRSGYGDAMAVLALVPLLLALLAAPAAAADLLAQDTTPGGSAFSGFPIALVVLAVVATVFALVWRSRKQKRQR